MEAVYHQNCDSSNEKAADCGAPRAITQYPKGNSNCSVSSRRQCSRKSVVRGASLFRPLFPAETHGACSPACPPVASWRLCVSSPALPLFSFSLCTLHSPLCTLDSCSPFPVPCSGLLGVIHNGACPKVPVKNHQIRVKIDQNGVKIVSKKVKKRAQIVMPILTFWGGTPSGASARAVLAFRNGHFGVVQGSKMPCGKVIHKMNNGEPGTGNGREILALAGRGGILSAARQGSPFGLATASPWRAGLNRGDLA
jgi:hypothetical protein